MLLGEAEGLRASQSTSRARHLGSGASETSGQEKYNCCPRSLGDVPVPRRNPGECFFAQETSVAPLTADQVVQRMVKGTNNAQALEITVDAHL